MLSEIAIVSTDLAELLGSAIGLCLIFPSIPLWASVLITASDVLIFLVLGDPSRGHGRPVKIFEWTVIALVSMISLEQGTDNHPSQVAVVFICFLVLLVRVGPNWPQAFFGYIPSKALFETEPDALYTGKRYSWVPVTVELNVFFCSCRNSRGHGHATRTVPRVLLGYPG